jgi:hypothetical protein
MTAPEDYWYTSSVLQNGVKYFLGKMEEAPNLLTFDKLKQCALIVQQL